VPPVVVGRALLPVLREVCYGSTRWRFVLLSGKMVARGADFFHSPRTPDLGGILGDSIFWFCESIGESKVGAGEVGFRGVEDLDTRQIGEVRSPEARRRLAS
jgi:hypothetical protein